VIERLRGFLGLSLQHSLFISAMRHPFQTQPDLQITPIEKIRLPLQSRDELPPILAGLQWIWMHPPLKAEIFALLEAKILAGKQATGAPAWTSGKSSSWGACGWGCMQTGIGWNTSPTTMLLCGRCWACRPPRGVRKPNGLGIRLIFPHCRLVSVLNSQ
jgi:hypothetical protein